MLLLTNTRYCCYYCMSTTTLQQQITQLSYIEFLEALARVSDMCTVPTDADLAAANCDDVLDYEAALLLLQDQDKQAALRERRPSATFTGCLTSTRPLAPKLDRVLRYLLGSLTIRFKGSLRAGTKVVNLVGVYASKQQVDKAF
jgi:hypothetical protein